MSKLSNLFNKLVKNDNLSKIETEKSLLPVSIGKKQDVIANWVLIAEPIFTFIGDDKYKNFIHDLFESCYLYFADLSFNGKKLVEESLTIVCQSLNEYKPHDNEKYNSPIFKCAWIHFQILANISVVDRLRVYVSDDENSKFWQFAHGIPLMTFLENESNEVYLEIKTLKRNSLFVMGVMLQHILPVKTKISFGAPLHLGINFLLMGKDPYHEAFAKWKMPNIKSIDNCYKELTKEQIQEKNAILKKELKLANDKAKERNEKENNYKNEIEKLSLALVRKEQEFHNELKKLKESINAVTQQNVNGNSIYPVNQQPSSMIPTPKTCRKPEGPHQSNSEQDKPVEPNIENHNNIPITNQRTPSKNAFSKTEKYDQGQPQPNNEHPNKPKNDDFNHRLNISKPHANQIDYSKNEIQNHNPQQKIVSIMQFETNTDKILTIANANTTTIINDENVILPPLRIYDVSGIKFSQVTIDTPCEESNSEETIKYLNIYFDRLQASEEKKIELISLFKYSINSPEKYKKFIEQFTVFTNLNLGLWIKAIKRGYIKAQPLDNFTANFIINCRKRSFSFSVIWKKYYADIVNQLSNFDETELQASERKVMVKCGMVFMKQSVFVSKVLSLSKENCKDEEKDTLDTFPQVFFWIFDFKRESCYRMIGFKHEYPNLHPAIAHQKSQKQYKFNKYEK